MPQAATTAVAVRPPSGRLWVGAAIVVMWLLVKLVSPIVIVGTDLSAEMKALLTAVLFFGVSKLCLLAVIVVLGKPGFAYLKAQIYGAFGRAFARIAPAREVSRTRYRIGLAMFVVPLLLGWIVPLLERVFPYLDKLDRPLDWFWDIVFVASFFVLGGDFWDKLRALFVHGAKSKFPDRPAEA